MRNCNLFPCFRIRCKEEFLCKKHNELQRKEAQLREIRRTEKILEDLQKHRNNTNEEAYKDSLDSKGKDITEEEFRKNEIFLELRG